MFKLETVTDNTIKRRTIIEQIPFDEVEKQLVEDFIKKHNLPEHTRVEVKLIRSSSIAGPYDSHFTLTSVRDEKVT